jgi:hypothetical protein
MILAPPAQALEGGFLVPEGFEECERELLPIERPLGQRRHGLLDFNGIHRPIPALNPLPSFPG